MDTVITFFIPDVGTGLFQAVLTIFNVLFVVASGFFLGFFFQWVKGWQTRGSKLSETPRAALQWNWGAMLGGFAIVFLFCALGIQSSAGTPDFTEGDLMWLLRRIADPMFSVSTMSESLSRHFTGINVMTRVLMLCVFIVLIRGVYRETRTMSAEFGDYLEKKFEEREKRAETREKEWEAELRTAAENTGDGPAHLEENTEKIKEKSQDDEVPQKTRSVRSERKLTAKAKYGKCCSERVVSPAYSDISLAEMSRGKQSWIF